MSYLFEQSHNTWTSKDQLKVVDQDVIFFNTFQYGKETDVWDESTSTGGTAVHDPDNSGVTMTVTSTINSEVVRQTNNVVRYIPGRSASVSFSVRFGTPVTGIRRRIGIFNEETDFILKMAAMVTTIAVFVTQLEVREALLHCNAFLGLNGMEIS